MTQAYNLSQLANNLDSSGRLDATDGLVNAVPVANGGTGAANATSARSNLGLGSLATQNTISNDNWSGTDLSVPNGGTGTSSISGVVYGNGASAMTAASGAQIAAAIGTTYVTNATNATNAQYASGVSGLLASQVAKAWVNYNGVTGTINGSYNVGSITVVDGNNTRVNFSSALSNTNYAPVSGWSNTNGDIYYRPPDINGSLSTTGYTLRVAAGNVTLVTSVVFG